MRTFRRAFDSNARNNGNQHNDPASANLIPHERPLLRNQGNGRAGNAAAAFPRNHSLPRAAMLTRL